ncbi:MAG: DUF4276 family protein [Thermodesulfobacteriota bacterium]
MRIHFFVEGLSEKTFLQVWLPRFLPASHSFKIIPHRGKGKIPGDPGKKPDPRRQGLLDQLPAKLRAYGKELHRDTDRIIVLVDLDHDDCLILKKKMVDLLDYCDTPPVALFRIAIEETEAFYLGDRSAIRAAFPKARISLLDTYIQDSICGTWELFMEAIRETSDDKVRWAGIMGRHLTTKWKGAFANKSISFQQFCKGILQMAGEPID